MYDLAPMYQTCSHSTHAHSALAVPARVSRENATRSEEHTSELQSLAYLVCRLLLEKKKNRIKHAAEKDVNATVKNPTVQRPRRRTKADHQGYTAAAENARPKVSSNQVVSQRLSLVR